MAERGISESEVDAVVAAPSLDYPSGYRRVLVGDGGLGKRVKVVMDPTLPEETVIITVAHPDDGAGTALPDDR
jgi:hypothetical protein